MEAIKHRLKRDIKAARRIEKELRHIKRPRLQQLRLLEYSRLDYLAPVERRIYLKNKMEVGAGIGCFMTQAPSLRDVKRAPYLRII